MPSFPVPPEEGGAVQRSAATYQGCGRTDSIASAAEAVEDSLGPGTAGRPGRYQAEHCAKSRTPAGKSGPAKRPIRADDHAGRGVGSVAAALETVLHIYSPGIH